MSTYKFGSSFEYQNLSKNKCEPIEEHFRQSFQKHFYGNIYSHEINPKWSRVTIGANEKQISLMLEIAEKWHGPYGILYVLLVPRLGHEDARYQSPTHCTFDELELFAYTFQEYFEGDARHELWIKDLSSENQLVYDNHDLIYSYGNDNDIIDFLKTKGFIEGSLKIPDPHQHQYNQEYDNREDEIMEYFKWIKFPLKDNDY